MKKKQYKGRILVRKKEAGVEKERKKGTEKKKKQRTGYKT